MGANIKIFCTFLIILCKFSEKGFQLKFLEVPVDHFSSENPNPTFKLYYAINNKYWNKQYGAIFFYAGWRIGLNNGKTILPNFARQFNALVIYAEHRYYGQSMPFGDKSLKDPKYFEKYLSTRQVLEDFVDLLFYVKTGTIRTTKNASAFNTGRNPIIAFGESYSGTLAAWFRKKYSHIIEGSLASSAPILYQELGCNAHYQKLTTLYENTVKGCPNLIRKSWAEFNKNFSSDFGKEQFSKKWNLCTKIKNPLDISFFKGWLKNQLWNTSYNPNSIKKLCNSINKRSDSGILKSIHNHYKKQGECIDFMKTSVWNKTLVRNKTSVWNIQACLELYHPQCSNGEHDMFEPEPWDFQNYSDHCYNLFKVRPIPNYIENEYGMINESNTSNIIFSNGDMDVWSYAGILMNLSESLIAIKIPRATHCWDLQKRKFTDSDALKNARNKYKITFGYWIHNYYERNGIKDVPLPSVTHGFAT